MTGSSVIAAVMFTPMVSVRSALTVKLPLAKSRITRKPPEDVYSTPAQKLVL